MIEPTHYWLGLIPCIADEPKGLTCREIEMNEEDIADTGEIVGVSTTLVGGGVAVNAAKIDTLTKMGKAADAVTKSAETATGAWKQVEEAATKVKQKARFDPSNR